MSVLGVAGELFATVGVLVLLFLGWQLWLNDLIVGGRQADASQALSRSWAAAGGVGGAKDDTGGAQPVSAVRPVVQKAPGNAQRFGILMVPRWGVGYERPIAEGIGVEDVLDHIGIGHYPGTQMPGQVGNFAIAAHRKAYGGGFEHLHQLRVGDSIWVETKAGWYRYLYRNSQYVLPSEVSVLSPVPEHPGEAATERLITLTTCNPFYSTAERIAAYGVFDRWYPRAGGPPAEIAATVKATGK